MNHANNEDGAYYRSRKVPQVCYQSLSLGPRREIHGLIFPIGVIFIIGLPCGSHGKESACNAGDRVPSLGQEYVLVKGMATHSSNLAWEIPWTEEPGRVPTVYII